MLIAKFVGDVDELKAVYDRGHALIMERGGAVPFGELRHHCATSEDALYIIGVWESADHIRRRWADDEFNKVLASVGFPTEPTERMILDLHQIEPPLLPTDSRQMRMTGLVNVASFVLAEFLVGAHLRTASRARRTSRRSGWSRA
jgi:hypothetical protein